MAISGPTTDHAEIRRWAESQNALPTEALPCTLDHEPSVMRFLSPETVQRTENVRVIAWDDFFIRFDELGLTFVYDQHSAHNELLQMEDRSPYRNPRYAPVSASN